MVPGIDERLDDFDVLLDEIGETTLSAMRARIEHMLIADNQLDGAYWRERQSNLRGLDQRQKEILRTVRWARHGNMRGLTAVVERIIGTGVDAELAVSALPLIEASSDGHDEPGKRLLARLQGRPATGDGLASHLRALELEERGLLQGLLQSDTTLLSGLARSLGLGESQLRSQLRTITRARRAGDED
jgi:DNA-binding NtrC family response regulator